MILPAMQGSAPSADFFIYAACDAGYFDEFGREFVNSARTNTGQHVHLHLFNPRADQLELCAKQGVSVSYESVPANLFDAAAEKWSRTPTDDLRRSQLERTRNAMSKGNDQNLHHRMQKTYYACSRFIRLAELAQGRRFVSMDVDAVVRRSLPTLGTEFDFYLHKITGRKARILAGGMYVHPQGRSQEFLNHYAQELRTSIEQDYIYWGLDQDILDRIVPGYRCGHLPITLIDWDMRDDSVVWTAKGLRKDSPKFVSEKQRYAV